MESLSNTLTDKSQRLFLIAVVTVIILAIALVIIIFTSRIKILKESLFYVKEIDLRKSNNIKILQESLEIIGKEDLALREELKQFNDTKVLLKSKTDLIFEMHEKMNILEEKERLDLHKIKTLVKDLQTLTFDYRGVQKQNELLLDENSRIRNNHTKMLMKTSQQERRIFEKLMLLSGNKREQRREIEKLADAVYKKNCMLFDTLRYEVLITRLAPLSSVITNYQKELMFDLEKHTGKKRDLQLDMITHARVYKEIQEDIDLLSWGPKEEGRVAYFGAEVIVNLLGKSGVDQEKYVKFKSSDNRGVKSDIDVIISLPNDQKITLDTSFSMDLYECYQHTVDLLERDKKFSKYLISLKSHVEKLAENMQKSASSSYYWMLIPDDEALNLALKQESHIYDQSITKHIVLVNPTMLLATLQGIAMLWDYKYHYSETDILAVKAEEMYGRFTVLSEEMSDASQRLEMLQESFLLDSLVGNPMNEN